MKKVVILGPESTGKSTLSKELAEFFKGGLVEEYARMYLKETNGNYGENDLLRIAKGQLNLEESVERKCKADNKRVIFYDTDITVIKIWSEFKYGKCHSWILQQYQQREYDLYLLTFPDLQWEPDRLRENPNDLKAIFDWYLKDLKRRALNYTIIRGQRDERTKNAILSIKDIL